MMAADQTPSSDLETLVCINEPLLDAWVRPTSRPQTAELRFCQKLGFL